MTPNAQQVIDCIELAFAGVRLEDGLSIRETNVMDHFGNDEERQQARAQDEQEDWRRVPDELISSHSTSLSYFEPTGMRFYLPAYMRFTLRRYQEAPSPSIWSTLFALGEDGAKLTLLTPVQKEAANQFLEFMASQDLLPDERDDAKRVLGECWM